MSVEHRWRVIVCVFECDEWPRIVNAFWPFWFVSIGLSTNEKRNFNCVDNLTTSGATIFVVVSVCPLGSHTLIQDNSNDVIWSRRNLTRFLWRESMPMPTKLESLMYFWCFVVVLYWITAIIPLHIGVCLSRTDKRNDFSSIVVIQGFIHTITTTMNNNALCSMSHSMHHRLELRETLHSVSFVI